MTRKPKAAEGGIDRPILSMVVRPGPVLAPASSYDAEELDHYRWDTRVLVTVEQPKQEEWVRFWFGLTGRVAKGIGVDPDLLRWRLKIRCGFAKSIVDDQTGEVTVIPQSIRDLDQPQLRELVNRASDIITSEIVPGASVEDILNETADYIGAKRL